MARQRCTAWHGVHSVALHSAVQHGMAQGGLHRVAWCSTWWHVVAQRGIGQGDIRAVQQSCSHSHSPLEISISLLGDSVGSRGFTRSSTVTAAMALMLVEAVLGEDSTQPCTKLRVGVAQSHPLLGDIGVPSGLTSGSRCRHRPGTVRVPQGTSGRCRGPGRACTGGHSCVRGQAGPLSPSFSPFLLATLN